MSVRAEVREAAHRATVNGRANELARRRALGGKGTPTVPLVRPFRFGTKARRGGRPVRAPEEGRP